MAMDRSQEYIRMCRLAEEIQQRWKRGYGDFYADETGRIQCWIRPPSRNLTFKQGFSIRVADDVIHLARHTWLPKQNQLIEMAQVPGRRYDSIVQEFFDWTKRPYETLEGTPARLFRSMERVWLAFVMQQKYHKQWDGNRWIKRLLPA
jgi:hypothetical protein